MSSTFPTASPTTPALVNHEFVGIGSLLFVVIILITLFSSKLIDLFQFHYINESTISIIFGLLIGMIIAFFPKQSRDLFSFDSEFFFFVLLPPIVFDAGFSLKRKNFFRNISSILIFAICGTIISTLIISCGLFALSYIGIIPLYNNANPLECILFATLISAVDPVGVLSVMGKKELNVDPTLYSLIFGESVLNDAVSIVLYKIFNDYSNDGDIISFESHFFIIIGQFCVIFICSFLIGVIIGLTASKILKHLSINNINCNQSVPLKTNKINKLQTTNNNNNNLLLSSDEDTSGDIIYLDEYRKKSLNEYSNTSFEFSMVILFAYLSYNIGEVLSLSGIVSVFSCGICMSHYLWHNLSWITQISLHHIIKSLASCCENFIYAFLGISTILSLTPSITIYKWNLLLILFTLLLCILSRAANIFPLSRLANIRRKVNYKITNSMQIMMFFSGLRGAIAFALSLNMNTPHKDIIITTTLSIVIITTVLCGSTTASLLNKLQLNKSNNDDDTISETFSINIEQHNKNTHNNQQIDQNYRKLNKKKFKVYSGLHKYWHILDSQYLQRWFGGSINTNHIGIYSNRKQLINQNIQQSQLINDHQSNTELAEVEMCDSQNK